MAFTSRFPRRPSTTCSKPGGGRTCRRLGPGLGVLALVVLALVPAGCGSNSGDAAPRLTTIPQQQAPGAGAMFALDLSAFASDPEGGPLSYVVLDGGGSFNGSTYENTFDTMGTYTVTFAVGDGTKATVGTFVVVVDMANFAVVRRDG